MTTYHKNLTGSDMHPLYAWTFVNTTVRSAVTGLTSDDVGKLAWQTDNDSFWLLTNHSPVTWKDLSSGSYILLDTSAEIKDGKSYRIVASSPITLTLPADPIPGTTIVIEDGESITATNIHTVARNGNTIMGQAEDLLLNVKGISFTIWFNYNEADWRLF